MDEVRLLTLAANILGYLTGQSATAEEARTTLRRCLKEINDADKRGDSHASPD